MTITKLTADAEKVLKDLGGYSDDHATKLVAAVREGAQIEALRVIAGGEAIPSNVADTRAMKVRCVCEAAKRLIKPREVELVLRVTPSTANSVVSRTKATYASALEQFLAAFVKSSASTPTPTGDAATELRWEIHFDDPAALDHAVQLLSRENITVNVRKKVSAQTLDIPRKVQQGNVSTDLLAVLGVDAPS